MMWIAGVKDPETIAEHSWRTAVIGAVLAMMEGADPAKVALLATFHDTQETRVGDIPWIGRRYLTAASNEAVTTDQVADAHPYRNAQEWVTSTQAKLKTPSAIALAEAALGMSSAEWQRTYLR